MSEQAAHEKSLEEEEHGAFLHGVPGYFGALGCGILALGLSSVTYIHALKSMAVVDIPIAVICLFASTLLALGSKSHKGTAFLGVLMSALGAILASAHLLVDHQHPWLF